MSVQVRFCILYLVWAEVSTEMVTGGLILSRDVMVKCHRFASANDTMCGWDVFAAMLLAGIARIKLCNLGYQV